MGKGEKLPATSCRCFNPIPTDFEVADAAKPMRVNPLTLLGLNDSRKNAGLNKGWQPP